MTSSVNQSFIILSISHPLVLDNLNKEYTRLKTFANDYQNNNEEYVKFVNTAGEKVLDALSNVNVLLRFALLSITESIRNNPERYRSLFYITCLQ